MQTLYEIGADGHWTGATRRIAEEAGAAPGWTRTAPPPLAAGDVAVWNERGWVVHHTAAIAPATADLLTGRRQDLSAALRSQRKAREAQGLRHEGHLIRSDAESHARLLAALQLLAADPESPAIAWEAQPGDWITLDRPAAEALALALGRHVQACFARARELQREIDAAETMSALETVEIWSGWPEGEV